MQMIRLLCQLKADAISILGGINKIKSVCIGRVYYLYMDSVVLEHPHTSTITTTIIILHSICTKFGEMSLLDH